MTIFSDREDVNPVVAEVVRSGFAESRHHGAVAGLASDGTQVISVGRTGVPFFPRSDRPRARYTRSRSLVIPGEEK